MKNKGLMIALITIIGIFAFTLTVGFIILLAKGTNFSFKFKDSNMNLIDTYEGEINGVNKIYFDLLSTDVEIKESKNGKVLVEYHSNQEKNAQIEFKDNTIIINEGNYNLSCFGICNVRRKVVLYLPVNNLEIELITKSGDIKSDIDLINANISTISGDIVLHGLESINIETTSGDISIDKVLKNFSIKTISGDVLIQTLDIKENSSINTISGDVVITNNKANCYVDFSSVSGEKLIKKSDRESEFVLTINTISGDVSVN